MQKVIETLALLKIPMEQHCALAQHSSFRIGGRAEVALFPTSREQLVQILQLADESAVPCRVFGNGSNVVFPDEGLNGITVFTKGMKGLSVGRRTVTADAGVSLSAFSRYAAEKNLSGAEFCFGIPGSVGGALYMNAGAFDRSISDISVSSDFWNPETQSVETAAEEAQAFSYRTSVFQTHPKWIILSATFALTPKYEPEIKETMEEYLRRRKNTQPLEYPSAGSVFKRPTGTFAGKLIEECRLKGTRIGGAEVSQKHAGFIVNRGGATAKDVRNLVFLIRQTVLEKTGILLEPEIEFIKN